MDTFAPSNPAYEETVRQILLSMPYVQWLGLTFQRIAPGEVEFLMPHRAEITFDGKALRRGRSARYWILRVPLPLSHLHPPVSCWRRLITP